MKTTCPHSIRCGGIITIILVFVPIKRQISLIFSPVTLSQTSPGFLRVCCTSILKTLLEKEKLLVTSNFSFSRSVLYQSRYLSAIFIRFETVVCKLFQFGGVYNLLFGKRLKVNRQWSLYHVPECKPILACNAMWGWCRNLKFLRLSKIFSDIRATWRTCSVPFLSGKPETTM